MMLQQSTRPGRPDAGLTIVEAVTGMAVFTVIAASILAVVFQIRKGAEQNVYENTALTMAQGYLEQVRSLSYAELKAACGTGPIRLRRAQDGQPALDTSGGPLNNGDWSVDTVFLDRDAAGSDIQPLTFRFRVDLSDLEPVTVARAKGIEITISYQTNVSGVQGSRTLRRTLRSVRSEIPTY